MAIFLSQEQALRLRLRAQRLDRQRSDAAGDAAQIGQVVADLCGIQAQEPAAAALAARARSTGLIAADVEYARVQEHSVVRTWGMRGTLHLLASEDLGWLLPLLGPVFIAASQRRYRELGLDEERRTEGSRAILDALTMHGPLTRAELVEQLAARSIRLEGQARPYLLSYAALNGLICLGPDREDGEPTYVLLDDWLDHTSHGSRLSAEAAEMELACRYLAAYAPAGPDDLAAWSGLPLSRARGAWKRLEDQLMEVDIAGQPAWMLKAQAGWLDELSAQSRQASQASLVRLLPRYDTYMLGYRSRGMTVAAQYAKRINAGGGIVHPTLLVGGRVLGIWRSTQRRNSLEVQVEPFETLAPDVQPGLEAEVTDIARFLGVSATVRMLAPH